MSVVIPALNEAATIGQVLADVPRWVYEVIVADNGSTDGTADAARRCGARVVVEPRRGYGSACLAALDEVDQPDVVVFLDADHSDDPRQMAALVEPIAAGRADLVIGSRVLGRRQGDALPPVQRWGNWLVCRLIQALWRVRFTDLGPFRAVRYSALRRIEMDDPDWGWTVQMQVRAVRRGLRCREVPVSFRRRVGRSKITGTLGGVVAVGRTMLSTILAEAIEAAVSPARWSTHAPPPPITSLSVIVPALNEERHIGAALDEATRRQCIEVQTIVVDGRSSDATVRIAGAQAVKLITVDAPGRSRQMNAGAAAATGEALLFLHADTRLPPGFARHVRRALAQPGAVAGAFALRIDGRHRLFRVIEWLVRWRCRLFHMPYGDQAIFVRADVFRALGGFAELPIMEDYVLMRRLRRAGRIVMAAAAAVTSARRWQAGGVVRTTLMHQAIVLAFRLGVRPATIARWRGRRGQWRPPVSSPARSCGLRPEK